MDKYIDTIVVGVITFIIVAIILAVKPGYTPIEVTDEILNPPVVAEEAVEDAPIATEEADS